MKNMLNIAYLGMGNRGITQMELSLDMEDINVIAVCDVYEDRVRDAVRKVAEKREGFSARGYTDYKKLIDTEKDKLDAVVITCSWQMHSRIAVYAMRAGIPAAFEVGGASSIEECWELVRAYEETGVPCMMLENCCYDRNEMALLKMVREGLFGEITHMEGAYGHDLRGEITHGLINRHYRFRNFQRRNGELYPTHELGPISKMLNLNRGNRMLTLVSMASKSRSLHTYIEKEFGADHPYMDIDWNEGDVVTTLIKCANGETIRLQHDNSSPRAYSRELRVQGTKGIYEEDGDRYILDGYAKVKDWDFEWDCFSKDIEKFEHPLWKWFRKAGVRGGHGGMDYLVQRAFFEAVEKGEEPPIDVYDSASWMAVTTLSEQSIALGSMPVPVPDFTNGLWIDRGDAPASGYSLDKVHEELFGD